MLNGFYYKIIMHYLYLVKIIKVLIINRRLKFFISAFDTNNGYIFFPVSVFISCNGIVNTCMKIITNDPESVCFCFFNIFKPVFFCCIGVIYHKTLSCSETSLKKYIFFMPCAKQVKRDSNVRFKKVFFKKS